MRDVRKLLAAGVLICSLIPSAAAALGLEAAVGGWSQDPSGDISYKNGTSLTLEDDLHFDTETKPFGRVKIDMPLVIPNIYLMATPMEFSGTGTQAGGGTFTFGNQTFDSTVPYTSTLKLDQYDIGLYYGIPFLQTATVNTLNVDVGINVRIMDFETTITGSVGGTTRTEGESATIPMPMVYLAAQVTPTDWLAIEAEGRGIAYSGNHYYDAIGRVKAKPFGPVFAAVGYRYQDLKIDEDDIRASITFSGPFAEAGVEF